MNFAIIGYYGANFGDLLMLDVLIRFFLKGNCSLSVFTYGDEKMLRGHLRENFSPKIDVNQLGRGKTKNFIKVIRGFDAVIWGGGTCFMDEGGTGGIKYMLLARALGIPVHYVGIGVDSCKKIKTRFCIALMGMIARNVIVRDAESERSVRRNLIFSRSKIQLIPDLAFGALHRVAKLRKKSIAERYVVVCLRDLNSYSISNSLNSNEAIESIAISVSKALGLKNFVFLIGDCELDEGISKSAFESFSKNGFRCELVSGNLLDLAIDRIVNSDFVVTVRLHPAVIAHMAAVPYAILNYSEKNRKFAAGLNSTNRVIFPSESSIFVADFSPPNNRDVMVLNETVNRTLHDMVLV